MAEPTTELGSVADLLSDLLDQAAAVFAAHECICAAVQLPCRKLFVFNRGEFFIEEQEIGATSMQLRTEAARCVPMLFKLCCERRDAVVRDMKDANAGLIWFIETNKKRGDNG